MAGAKRKIELFVEIQNEKEFEHALKTNADELICGKTIAAYKNTNWFPHDVPLSTPLAIYKDLDVIWMHKDLKGAEIYCTFAGSCTALDKLFTTIKLDWSSGRMVLLKVPADEIEALKRFRDHSEPVFMFILRQRVTKVFRGVDSLRFADVAKREWDIYNMASGVEFNRPTYEIHEATPDETEWIRKKSIDRQSSLAAVTAKRVARQAARKQHRAELMVPFLRVLNFVLFWPHCFHAHPELYEKWDMNNIIMVGREEVQLTEETARDVLYSGDAPLNEASINTLLSGSALAICFRLLDTDKHFASLVRRILYQDIPVYDDAKPTEAPQSRVPAFDQYKTYSPTREAVLENRRKEKIRLREEVLEKRARRLSEMQRLARQEIEDSLEAQRIKREHRRLELLKSGNLKALKEFDQEPDEEVQIDIPEELPDEYVEEEIVEDPDEYLPPPGLLIPGFYAPPNDVAKVNGLAILFPKLVAEYVTPEPEFLPRHVLVMLEISQAYKAIVAMAPFKKYIIHVGVFKATSPFDGQHLAYSVKQYDTLDMNSRNWENVKLVFMLSIEKDLPLLQLMELSPVHVSRDMACGGDECAVMFPVGYGDNYHELEDFDIAEDIKK